MFDGIFRILKRKMNSMRFCSRNRPPPQKRATALDKLATEFPVLCGSSFNCSATSDDVFITHRWRHTGPTGRAWCRFLRLRESKLHWDLRTPKTMGTTQRPIIDECCHWQEKFLTICGIPLVPQPVIMIGLDMRHDCVFNLSRNDAGHAKAAVRVWALRGIRWRSIHIMLPIKFLGFP